MVDINNLTKELQRVREKYCQGVIENGVDDILEKLELEDIEDSQKKELYNVFIEVINDCMCYFDVDSIVSLDEK